jgi:hypothetical protein
MTRIDALSGRCCVVAVLLLAACGKDDVAQDKSFDAAFVAAEADRGNLAPLKSLMDRCKSEVEQDRGRGASCKQLDSARALRAPLNIRFQQGSSNKPAEGRP